MQSHHQTHGEDAPFQSCEQRVDRKQSKQAKQQRLSPTTWVRGCGGQRVPYKEQFWADVHIEGGLKWGERELT
jgi:hypothetical protein